MSPSLPSAPSRRAFALLDAVVGTIVLALGLVALLGVIGSALAAQRRGEQIETAARLADERLALVTALGPEAYPSALPLSGVCDPPFEAFSYTVTLTPASAGQPYTVRAVISWEPAPGRTRSISIDTLLAPRPGEDPDPDRRPKQSVGRNTDG